MKGFFVTGTGTGVGKTVVSLSIIGALRSMGIDACGMKPVESGCQGQVTDGMLLRDASGAEEPMDLITPFALSAALAPLSAARLEGRNVDKEIILASARELSLRHEALVVEGVGGFLVPIAEGGYLVRDMARDMGLPVIISATPYLGTVNHTLLTVEAVQGAGLRLAGVVLNSTDERTQGAAEQSGRELIEELTGIPLLGYIPYVKGASISRIMEEGRSCINTSMLQRYL